MDTNINLATYVVRGADGAVDRDATVGKFSEDLDTFVAERDTEEGLIADAVSQVFDDLGPTKANMPYVISMTLQKLGVSQRPSMYKILSDRVHAYLKENSKEGGLYQVSKGKGGGISVRSQTTDSE